METIFLKLFNMSVSAGWMVLAVVFVRFFLRKAPRYISVILWALVGVRLLLPFSIESIISLIPSAQTVPPEILYTQTPIIHSGFTAVNAVINPILSQTMAPTPSDSVNPMQVLTTVASIVWAVGCVGFLLYGVISYCRIHRRVRGATHLFGNVYRSSTIDTPFILGMIRPKIYLPFEMNGNDIPYVLDHEQAHLKRLDHLWKPLGFLLLAVYWFNPLLWLAYVLLCRDIESACDERVAKEMNVEEKKAYSSALLNCSVSRRVITACPLAFGEVGVKQRIRSVLHYKKPTVWVVAIALITCAAIAVCFLTDPKTDDPAPTDGYVEYESVVARVQYSTEPLVLVPMVNYIDVGIPLYRITDTTQLDEFCTAYNAEMTKHGYSKDVNFNHYTSQYSASFFEKNELFVSFINASSGSFCYDVVSAVREQSLLRLFVAQTNNPPAHTADMAKWMFLVSISKDDLEGCDKYDVQYQNYRYDAPIAAIYDHQYWCEDANAQLMLTSKEFGAFQLMIGTGTDGSTSLFSGNAIQNEEKVICYAGPDVFIFYFDSENLRYERTKPSTVSQSLLPSAAVFKPRIMALEQYEVLYGVAVGDIDGDGIEEKCSLGMGPTSGRFSFTFKASNDTGVEYSQVFYSNVYTLSFVTDENGKLLVRGEEKGENAKVHFFEIGVKDGNIILSENGKPISEI